MKSSGFVHFMCNRVYTILLSSMKGKPSLIIFDLDLTLWPFRVDRHTKPPFNKNTFGNIVDSVGKKVECYTEVPQVLKKLKNDGYVMAVASRIEHVDGAEQLLELFELNSYFTYKEIYPGSKVAHFEQFQNKSGVKYSDMLFFDDDKRNIRDISRQGVTAIQVPDGINMKVVEDALLEFSSEKEDSTEDAT